MTLKHSTKLIAGAGVAATILAAPPAADATPRAEVSPQQSTWPGYCMDKPDILCMFDSFSWAYGQIYTDNGSWNFGTGNNWNNRADVFKNNRTLDVCIYSGEYGQGTTRRLLSNTERSWSNYGSSNKWRSPGTACP